MKYIVSQSIVVSTVVDADSERDAVSKTYAYGGLDFICAYENTFIYKEGEITASEMED